MHSSRLYWGQWLELLMNGSRWSEGGEAKSLGVPKLRGHVMFIRITGQYYSISNSFYCMSGALASEVSVSLVLPRWDQGCALVRKEPTSANGISWLQPHTSRLCDPYTDIRFVKVWLITHIIPVSRLFYPRLQCFSSNSSAVYWTLLQLNRSICINNGLGIYKQGQQQCRNRPFRHIPYSSGGSCFL